MEPMVPAPERKGAEFWLSAIDEARKRERPWRERARKVVERYRDERSSTDDSVRMNILWSNTDVLMAALYSRTPTADVRRRYMGDDDAARDAALALERYLTYSLDSYNFDSTVRDTLKDYLLVGRGTARVRLETDTYDREDVSEEVAYSPDGMPMVTSTTESVEEILDQRIICEPVHWADLVIQPARCWREVEWIAFRHMLDRDELKAQFGAIGAKVNFTHSRRGDERDESEELTEGRAEVFEVFDKRNRRRIFVSHGTDKVLEEEEDPYGLTHFFPIPEPLYSVRTTDTLIPVCEYTLYQDQVQELDLITSRISALTDALKRRGVFDASMKELSELAMADDNVFIPVDNYSSMLERGGLAGVMAEAPIQNLAAVLQQLYQARALVIETIFEVVGISDITRGVSADRETATTSRTKAFFGSLRLVNRKREVIRFIRDIMRLKGELVAEHLDPVVMGAATQIKITPEVFMALRDEMGRGYRIDIETDDSVAYDEAAERQQRIEVLTAAGNFIGQSAELVQSGALPFEAAKQLLMFGLRGFKKGRELEDLFESLQPPPPPQQDPGATDPGMQLAIVEREARAKEAELRGQIEQLKASLKNRELDLRERDMVQNGELEVGRLQLRAQEIEQAGELKREEMALKSLELEQNDG